MRKKILTSAGIIIAILLLSYLALKVDFYVNFVQKKAINIVCVDTISCNFVIPVKYVDNKLSELPGKAIYTPEKQRYSLRYSAVEDKLFITVNQMAWYGLTFYSARYEITDKNIHDKLLELYKRLCS